MARPLHFPSARVRKARSSLGGRARAKVLSPRRRSEIAKLGWLTRRAIALARERAEKAALAEE